MGIDVHPVTLIKRGRELRERELRELEPRLAQAQAALDEQGPAAREAVDQARAAWEALRGATFEQLKRVQLEAYKQFRAERNRRDGLEGALSRFVWGSDEPRATADLAGVPVLGENVVDSSAMPDKAMLVAEAAEALRLAQAALQEFVAPVAHLKQRIAGLRSQNDAAAEQLARLAPAAPPVLEPGLWAKMREVLARDQSRGEGDQSPRGAAEADLPPRSSSSSSGGAGATAPPSPPGSARPAPAAARPRKES